MIKPKGWVFERYKIVTFLEYLKKKKKKLLRMKKVTNLDTIKISKIRHCYNNFISLTKEMDNVLENN